MVGLRFVSIATVLSCACALASARDARAFGCFQEPSPEPQITVTDHRIAFSIQPAQTIVWDQMRFTGSPADFAWVLPVRPGAVISLSQEAWFDALEESTQPIVVGGQECDQPGSSPNSDPGPASPFGCGGGSQSTAAAPTETFVDAGRDTVHIVTTQVVGPYVAVTVHASQGASIGAWLMANGYVNEVSTTLAAYADAGFDFLALKLAPGFGVGAMQPVRVVTPGADTTLPLRMLATAGDVHVGIKLFVLSTGRYHPANYPDVTLDSTQLEFDVGKQQSNYEDVVSATLSAGAGTGWLTESAEPAWSNGDAGPNPGLGVTYASLCQASLAAAGVACAANGDAGDAGDAGIVQEAGDDGDMDADAASGEASTVGDASGEASIVGDASAGDAATLASCAPVPAAACDDFALATMGIDPNQFWVTRLRANLAAQAIVTDLTLTTTPDQTAVANVLQAQGLTDPNSLCPNDSAGDTDCAVSRPRGRGRNLPLVALSFGLIFGAWALRRRR